MTKGHDSYYTLCISYNDEYISQVCSQLFSYGNPQQNICETQHSYPIIPGPRKIWHYGIPVNTIKPQLLLPLVHYIPRFFFLLLQLGVYFMSLFSVVQLQKSTKDVCCSKASIVTWFTPWQCGPKTCKVYFGRSLLLIKALSSCACSSWATVAHLVLHYTGLCHEGIGTRPNGLSIMFHKRNVTGFTLTFITINTYVLMGAKDRNNPKLCLNSFYHYF